MVRRWGYQRQQWLLWREQPVRAWTTWPRLFFKVYSFGKQVVEKVETEHALVEWEGLCTTCCTHPCGWWIFSPSCGSCWSAMRWTISWRASPSSRWWQSETLGTAAPPTSLWGLHQWAGCPAPHLPSGWDWGDPQVAHPQNALLSGRTSSFPLTWGGAAP